MSAISWLTIENSFPTFLDGESPQQQIKKLQDYMFKLTDQLKYSLQNLDTSNWNKAALDKFTEETAASMVEEVKNFAAELTRVQAMASELSGRITGVAGRVTRVEEEITYLQQLLDTEIENLKQLQENISTLEQTNTETQQLMTELQEEQNVQNARLAEQESVVQPGEEEDTIGNVGRVLHLVGTIYVNGVLLEMGGTENETA